MAATAFGSVGGVCHGVGAEERFNASSWHKPLQKRSGGGQTIRISVPGLDKSLTEQELRLVAKAAGGMRFAACGNRECCPHGLEDMIKNWRAHALKQSIDSLKALESVPDLLRPRQFIDKNVVEASQVAHKIASLKIADKELAQRLLTHSRKIDEFRSTMNNLYEIRGNAMPRSLSIRNRADQSASSTIPRGAKGAQ